MGFIKSLNSITKRLDEHFSGPKPPPRPSREDRVKEAANIITNCSITCYCGGLSVPVKFSGKIYRCIRCNKQFANAQYRLAQLSQVHISTSILKSASSKAEYYTFNSIMTFYEDAIILIKEEDSLQ